MSCVPLLIRLCLPVAILGLFLGGGAESPNQDKSTKISV